MTRKLDRKVNGNYFYCGLTAKATANMRFAAMLADGTTISKCNSIN